MSMRLYRYAYLPELGYVVYRHHDEGRADVAQKAIGHKVAVFVSEDEASDYCDYRNEHLAKNNTDDVYAIRR
jgi:hypothetical protein